tara:strand:+ start:416 stop:1036 length:621 start_codon:yes stop_codon:yes gene_type:complete
MPDFIQVMKYAYGNHPLVENPKRILLVSLRHTGSFFFCNILKKQYFNWDPMMLHYNANQFNTLFPSISTENAKHAPSYIEDFNPFIRIHTEWESTILEYWNRFNDDEKPIVITLERDLNKVKQSYRRRFKERHPMSIDDSISESMADVAFEKHYKHHLSVLEQIKPDFTLSVDAEDKQARLDELATTLGIPLSTNWEPINSTSHDI